MNHMTKEQVDAWREAAVRDGWVIEEMYSGESIETAARAEKGGFVAHILNREYPNATVENFGREITVWGPDGLVVLTPAVYGWQALLDGLRHCNTCGKDGVETQRYSFAGRCCAGCRPAMAKQHEYPGWAD